MAFLFVFSFSFNFFFMTLMIAKAIHLVAQKKEPKKSAPTARFQPE
jgi:hypothetical protein